MNSWFGTDGLRGLYGQTPLTPQGLGSLGHIIGKFFRNIHPQPKLCIAYDTRTSGIEMHTILASALHLQNVESVFLGVMPTASVGFFVQHHGYTGGLMLTASHNPHPYNGIKIFHAHGHKLRAQEYAHMEKQLRDAMHHCPQKTYEQKQEESQTEVSLGPKPLHLSHAEEYVAFCTRTAQNITQCSHYQGLRIALDTANGALSFLGPKAFRAMGAEVVHLVGNTPHGENINHDCGALYPKKLQEIVVRHQCHMGFAFDGDGDRVVMIDAQGHLHNGDEILAYMATKIETPGLAVTDFSNGALVHFLKNKQKQVCITPVGDHHVLEALQQRGWRLGGEPSGHILLPHLTSSSDGLLVALLLCGFLQKDPVTLPLFTPLPQKICNIPMADPDLLRKDTVRSVIATYEGILQDQGGRLCLRPSGTEPVLRILLEGPCVETLRSAIEHITHALCPQEENTPLDNAQ